MNFRPVTGKSLALHGRPFAPLPLPLIARAPFLRLALNRSLARANAYLTPKSNTKQSLEISLQIHPENFYRKKLRGLLTADGRHGVAQNCRKHEIAALQKQTKSQFLSLFICVHARPSAVLFLIHSS
jgi:hypothetical protein